MACVEEIIKAVRNGEDLNEFSDDLLDILLDHAKQYVLEWTIKKRLIIHAESEESAENYLMDMVDCEQEGSYVEDSFDIVKIEEVEE